MDDSISRPYSQEFSGHVEREIVSGLSGRMSYVYKQVRDEWVEIDPTRDAAMTIPFSFVDIGADGVSGTADDQTLSLLDRPASTPQTRLFANPTDPAYNSDFQTVEFAINRRFAGRWMLLTSFGYTWLDQFHATTTGTGTLDALAQAKTYNWRSNQNLFGDEGKETSTLWNYKIIGRYTMPWQIGFSGSWKVQSGRQWGRNTAVAFPGDGTQNIRMEEVTANRAPTVSILDLRADKSFTFGRYGRFTAMLDMFNTVEQRRGRQLRDHHGADLQAGHRHPRPAHLPLRHSLRLLVAASPHSRREPGTSAGSPSGGPAFFFSSAVALRRRQHSSHRRRRAMMRRQIPDPPRPQS